jgi:hypothetical protein
VARGWESKAVEAQIDAAASKSKDLAPALTPEERERLARKSSLVLARVKAAKDLESTQNPRFKAILMRALADLDRQLSDLEVPTAHGPRADKTT